MIQLGFLVLSALVMIVPLVLYQSLIDQAERPFWLSRPVVSSGGPYRASHGVELVAFELPARARGAVAFSFLFAVLGLLLAMPIVVGVLCQWGGAVVAGLPALGMAMAASVAGIHVLRRGPAAAGVAGAVGLGQVGYGLWLLAVVTTVTEAQQGPVAGWIEQTVVQVLFAVGGHPRNGGWALPFSVAEGLGLLPVLYATASLVHGLLLLATAQRFWGLRASSLRA